LLLAVEAVAATYLLAAVQVGFSLLQLGFLLVQPIQ
jgi:hypothetical protein